MTSLRNDLAIGISLARHEFKVGDPIELHIWVDNSGDAVKGVYTCWELEWFKRAGFQVWSKKGHQILSREQVRAREKCSTDPRAVSMWGGPVACARNILLRIPPRTCITRSDYDFAVNLSNFYDLPPGEYVLRLRTDWKKGINLCSHHKPQQFHARPDDVTFTVSKS